MKQLPSNNSDFILYTSSDGEVRVDVFVNDETVWLTQKAIANLFDVDRTVITKYLKNIFDSSELEDNSVCAKIAHTSKGLGSFYFAK
jgi:hypothetical protein